MVLLQLQSVRAELRQAREVRNLPEDWRGDEADERDEQRQLSEKLGSDCKALLSIAESLEAEGEGVY